MKLQEIINQINMFSKILKTYNLHIVVMNEEEFKEYAETKEQLAFLKKTNKEVEKLLKLTFKKIKTNNKFIEL